MHSFVEVNRVIQRRLIFAGNFCIRKPGEHGNKARGILMRDTVVGAMLIAMVTAPANHEGLMMNKEEQFCFGASVRVAGKI